MTASRRRHAGGASPIDVHVGSRARLRRTMLRMSQEKLAAELELSFQQVQKYERAANRIGASRYISFAGYCRFQSHFSSKA
jgi:transcriptional regulator with XRE-family HTH domain